MSETSQTPAAQYLRMSTDDQQFSIANQQAKIRDYAKRHGFSIVCTYADAGRSGVAIGHRRGLRELLRDVIGGNAGYKAVLVYDVSRWGRFQNPDEAAHYEFLCDNAGIPVHYCAEQFNNDGTMASSLMKALKRTMAAEYSRELSMKVYDGQKRFAQMGFRVGGKDLYGLRRMVITGQGNRRFVLERGERKGVTTDHVILVPGPKNEVDCIRGIFHRAAYEGKSPSEIAKDLNLRKIKFIPGHEWDKDAVWRTLRSPQYAGHNVWNRTTAKMHSKRKFNPRVEWIQKVNAFEPLVDEVTFQRAQKMLKKRRTWPAKPDEEIIGRLKSLLAKKGKLSHSVMKKARGLYEPRTYYSRYGSYLKLYELVGYEVSKERLVAYNRATSARLVRRNLLDNLHQRFPDHVRVLRLGRNLRKVLEIDGHLIVSVFICRQFFTLHHGLRRWRLEVPKRERGNIALVCQVDLDSGQTFGHWVVSAIGNDFKQQKEFGENDPWLERGRKLHDLSEFYEAILLASHS